MRYTCSSSIDIRTSVYNPLHNVNILLSNGRKLEMLEVYCLYIVKFTILAIILFSLLIHELSFLVLSMKIMSYEEWPPIHRMIGISELCPRPHSNFLTFTDMDLDFWKYWRVVRHWYFLWIVFKSATQEFQSRAHKEYECLKQD